MATLARSMACICIPLAMIGCSNNEQPSTATPISHHSHSHPSTGPHGGDLIELGDEEYHGELVHDEKAETVTIYILDTAAKTAVPIEGTEVVINLKHDGQPQQHKLAAEPQKGETGGKSSRFVARDNHELNHAIEEDGADARLLVTIDGKTFNGKIDHKHDHDEEGKHSHDHEHEHENNE